MRIKKILSKRGELTTKQLVTIIVIIVSFIIILFLILRLNLGGKTFKEVCHNSVILNSQSGGFSGPLDCTTTSVCISGGGKCQKTNPSSTIKINLRGENPKKEILEAIAKEMVDCWWMFGEGEVKYVSETIFTSKTSCAVCSIIEFDEKIQNSGIVINYRNLYDYLNETPKTSTQTYLDYLYSENDLGIIIELGLFPKLEHIPFNFSKDYSIITGIHNNPIVGFWEDSMYLKPLILESTPESYSSLGCDNILSKSG
ncbi:hypothetical protein K0A97_02445 [Patescibacteria group bacterium]|nr:hypothetical protein [Patescibacteria group bacterium]